jgi:hypothetical protein
LGPDVSWTAKANGALLKNIRGECSVLIHNNGGIEGDNLHTRVYNRDSASSEVHPYDL